MHMNYGKNRSVHFVELHEKFYVHHESDGKRSIRLKEKWVVSAKGADFKAIGEHFGIDPVIARIMRNRGLTDLDEMEYYLHGDEKDLIDPHLLKDVDLAAEIILKKVKEQKKIRIIGDYDIDGIQSTYILYCALKRIGAEADYVIPHRIRDGYGMNEHLVTQAAEAGINTILTCDNGISAIDQIHLAKELGMTVVVTDHHEVPYIEENGVRREKISEADAIVNPKQMECTYPYKNLCGAAVAWKVIQILYEKCDIAVEESYDFLENVAFATVGDVMDLTDENRILVREGLKRIHTTMNPGMRALILQNKLEPEQISSYHFGFVLGPCINASGRLETAKIALNLFLQEDVKKASEIAAELVDLNAQRKDMTAEGVELAMQQVEEGNTGEKVLVVYLPDVHESLAGIIAGRIREACHKPTFVLTKSEDGVKGSGRSVEAYSMYEELCKCQELFTKFGGHPMAAGLSLPEANVEIFREKINACCGLTEEDFIPKIKIDIPMPVDYPDIPLVNELLLLEPFGKANVKPQFADKNLGIDRAVVVGKNQNVLKLTLKTERGKSISAVYFGDVEEFREYYGRKYGENEVQQAFLGRTNGIRMSVVYYPEINRYQGNESIQIVIKNYQ